MLVYIGFIKNRKNKNKNKYNIIIKTFLKNIKKVLNLNFETPILLGVLKFIDIRKQINYKNFQKTIDKKWKWVYNKFNLNQKYF